jgi:cell division protein FtsZ
VSLPFEFEGERRRQQALEGVEALRGEADAVIAVPNDKLFKMVDGRASVPEAFRQANNILVQVVRAIDRLLSRTGLINLDFADLKAVLKKPHTQTLFGFGEGQSEKKLSQAVAGIFASPLLENGKLIEGADEMLVSIVGGPDLTYADVQETMSQLSRHASERTHIMVGAAIDEAFTGKLSITVIASTGHAQAAARGRMTVGATGGVSEASRTSPRSHVKDTKSVGGLKEKPVSPEKQADKVEGETVPVATCTSSTEQVSAEATSTDGRVIRIDAGETGTIGTPIPIERTPAQKARPVTNAAVPPVRVGHAHAVANLGASGSNAAVKPAQTNAEQNPAKPRQTALPLELEAKGCFGRGEPNLHEGEDLDIPTFLRRGIRV